MIFKPLNVQANLKVTKCKSSRGGGRGRFEWGGWRPRICCVGISLLSCQVLQGLRLS